MTVGLEDVVVADTELSRVDGLNGQLILRGRTLGDLAERGFAGAVAHLWEDPSVDEAALGQARQQAWAQLASAGVWDRAEPAERDGMDAVRAAVAALGEASDLEVVAAVGVAAGAWLRRRRGQSVLRPDPGRSHAGDLLRAIRPTAASPAEVRALDAYLVTVLDHGLNASTFAARVVASTGSDRVSAVVAGLGALKGPLHGGAPGPVLDMLDAVGTPERAAEWVDAELSAGRRTMGMGHRVYRVRDPRAAVLERALNRLNPESPNGRMALARAVESAAEQALTRRKPDRIIKANVEFATALLLEALGVPRSAFTVVFATSRVAGWVAHAKEQAATGRLLRPRARYVGPTPA